jgi:hypothetical protein
MRVYVWHGMARATNNQAADGADLHEEHVVCDQFRVIALQCHVHPLWHLCAAPSVSKLICVSIVNISLSIGGYDTCVFVYICVLVTSS